MKFTVDRARWRCGGDGKHKHGTGETALLNKLGCRCCLGFVASQTGVPDGEILEHGEPCSVSKCRPMDGVLVDVSGDSEYGIDVFNTTLTFDAMNINDHEGLTRPTRERKLRELFAKHGHELEFVGEYAT